MLCLSGFELYSRWVPLFIVNLRLVPALFVSSVHPVVAPTKIFHCLTSEARFPWRTSTVLVSETQQKTLL